MSGKFAGLFDQLGDALAELAAAEISEPNDLDDLLQGLATLAEDFAWPYSRHAERLHDMPGLVRWIPDLLWEASMDAHQVSMRTEPLQGFTVMGGR